MTDNKKILLSGVKPTGRPHIGNYFGAMKQFVDLQNNYRNFIMIADYHALTSVQNAGEMRQLILDLAIDYLAIGLDPEKVVIFKQSDVPEHTELAWIFNCLTTMPYLMRAHAFKDAEAKNKEVNVGLFDYPLLMAADILLYDTDAVPVGQDQKQHLEITRDTAEKFNRIFPSRDSGQVGDTFKLPEPLILSEVQTIPGIDGLKMSKSYGNTISLFASDREITQSAMSIKTDSKGVEEAKNPEECIVFALHKLFSIEQLPELKRRYVEGGIGYKESKEILAANIIKFIAPLRAKREEIASNPERVISILRQGAEVARGQAKIKMEQVRKVVGVNL
jgi:tryptophanyl-tRNA synthetase